MGHKMKSLLYIIIGIACVCALDQKDPEQLDVTGLEATTGKEEEILDDALLEGLMDGYTFTLDCVTMSKYDHTEQEPTEKEVQKDHDQNVEDAKLDASFMTKHRPLESNEVKPKEASLFARFNILLHYLNSRGQEWSLKEPKDLGFEESNEKHMVFESKANDAADIKIPQNLFYTVGNMNKSIAVHKDNKRPILLTCLESFIATRLGLLSMQGLAKSDAPVTEKLEYLRRWIKIAKEHFVLYLPYIAITAPRCHDLLKSEYSDDVRSEYGSNDHYKHLHGVCKKMIKKRDHDGLLQTYVMLDSDLHPELMKRTLSDRHLFPLLLQEKDNVLRTIHKHHQHEMDWDQFQTAGNYLLAELEQQLLDKNDWFLKPESWGIGLDAEKSKAAEKELIKKFVKSQKKLNLKAMQTVRSIAHDALHKSKKSDEDFKKTTIKFSEKEQEAAKRASSTDKALAKCMEDAAKELEKDAKEYKNSNFSNIANKLKNFEHDSWMECASSRIFDKLLDVCDNDEYCKKVIDDLNRELKSVDPDRTASIAIENLLQGVTAALLKKDKLDVQTVKKHVLKVSNEEIKEMSETDTKEQGGSTQTTTEKETPAESEGTASGE